MGNLFLQLHDITGESIDHIHSGEIEIRGWKWSMTYPKPSGLPTNMKPTLGPSTAAASTDTDDKFNVHNIVIEKYFDAASVALARYCCKGKQIASGTITCRKNYGEHKLEYLIIDLKKVKIRSVTWPGGGEEHGELVDETVELVFGEFDVTYTQQANEDPSFTPKQQANEDPRSGVALGSTNFCWNVTDNKQVGQSTNFSRPDKFLR